MLDLLAALAVGYLLGGLPTAAIAARLRGADIFEVGSGNMGAMNTARNLGLPLGVAVALVDVGKGALATYLGMLMAEVSGRADAGALLPALAAGFGAVLGHGFSPWAHFRGGKAIATTFGVSLPLYPIAGLYYLALIVAVYLLTRRFSPGAGVAGAVAALVYPLVTLLLLPRFGWGGDELFTLVTGLVPLSLVVLVKYWQAWRRHRRPPAPGAPARCGARGACP